RPRSKLEVVPDQRRTASRTYLQRSWKQSCTRSRCAASGTHTAVYVNTLHRIRLRRSRVSSSPTIRLGVDIGGTFTDVALELGERRFTAKTLTTTAMPEKGVLAALGSVTAEAGISPDKVGLIIHGTTLATNA